MNYFAALGSAIYGRMGTVQYSYHASGTAITTGTLGCYDSLAPQSPPTQPPYVIFQLQDSLDMYDMSGVSGESADYVLKAVSNRQDASAQAFAIYDQAHNHFQDAPLSVTGGYLLRCRRIGRVQYQDSDKFWHVGGIYRLDSWES
jgi:hypothetical protein